MIWIGLRTTQTCIVHSYCVRCQLCVIWVEHLSLLSKISLLFQRIIECHWNPFLSVPCQRWQSLIPSFFWWEIDWLLYFHIGACSKGWTLSHWSALIFLLWQIAVLHGYLWICYICVYSLLTLVFWVFCCLWRSTNVWYFVVLLINVKLVLWFVMHWSVHQFKVIVSQSPLRACRGLVPQYLPVFKRFLS